MVSCLSPGNVGLLFLLSRKLYNQSVRQQHSSILTVFLFTIQTALLCQISNAIIITVGSLPFFVLRGAFYGDHNGLVGRFGISVSQMTTDMFRLS